MSHVTHILSQIESGDPSAAELLLSLVYDELRKLAAAKLASEKPEQTLQATALVHEAYLRLVDVEQTQHWNSRGHFFGAAAEAMRRILVEQARRRQSVRSGDKRFKKVDASAAKIVKLKFFAGLTIPQIAEALGILTSTVDRSWAYARAWLHSALKQSDSGISE